MKQLNNKQFMTIGMYLFLITAVANLFFFIQIFKTLYPAQIISQLAGISFNFLLAYMFNIWRNQDQTSFIPEYKEPENMEEELEKLRIS